MISMLKQNINLLQKEDSFAPRLSLKRIGLVWLILLLFYSVYGLWLFFSYQSLAKQNAMLLAQQAIADNKMRLLAQTKSHNIHIPLPLSRYLEGIKSGGVAGTFLNEFYLESNGNKVLFRGQAQDITLLPKLLSSWQQGNKLKNQVIGNIQIEKLNASDNAVQFSFEANN